MRDRILGTLTIGQAPRPDVVPIIDRYVASRVRRIHRGVLDGLSRAEIDARYKPGRRRAGAGHPIARRERRGIVARPDARRRRRTW